MGLAPGDDRRPDRDPGDIHGAVQLSDAVGQDHGDRPGRRGDIQRVGADHRRSRQTQCAPAPLVSSDRRYSPFGDYKDVFLFECAPDARRWPTKFIFPFCLFCR